MNLEALWSGRPSLQLLVRSELISGAVAAFQALYIKLQQEGRRLRKIKFYTVSGLDQHNREDRLPSFKGDASFLGGDHIA